jgi:hypothetical protein
VVCSRARAYCSDRVRYAVLKTLWKARLTVGVLVSEWLSQEEDGAGIGERTGGSMLICGTEDALDAPRVRILLIFFPSPSRVGDGGGGTWLLLANAAFSKVSTRLATTTGEGTSTLPLGRSK